MFSITLEQNRLPNFETHALGQRRSVDQIHRIRTRMRQDTLKKGGLHHTDGSFEDRTSRSDLDLLKMSSDKLTNTQRFSTPIRELILWLHSYLRLHTTNAFREVHIRRQRLVCGKGGHYRRVHYTVDTGAR